MANNKKWQWKNGRLHHPESTSEGLSVGLAYKLSETHDGIAEACKGVLKPCTEATDRLNRQALKDLAEEQEARTALWV
jgi:hypothetical protein